MYEESLCFDPTPMVDAILDNNGGYSESTTAAETGFPVSNQFQPPILVTGNTTNSFNDDLRLPTMEEFSVFPSVVSFPSSEIQNLNDNNHMIQEMIHGSNWDNSGLFMNTSVPNTTTTPTPDLLSLLHLPRRSMPLPSSNVSDILSGSCFTYDPLFHLNLPPQPPLFPSANYDYSGFFLDTNTSQRDQSSAGDENNNAQLDSGIIDFSKKIRRKGRGKQKNKPFTTERERRCHLNDQDRASILQDGIDYIKELQRRVSELKHQRNKRPHYHPLNPAKSGGGTQKKVNSMVLFDQETNNKLRSEAPMFKLINQSLLFCWRFHEAKVTGVVRRRNREVSKEEEEAREKSERGLRPPKQESSSFVNVLELI
ncbi:hypothetical protein F2Q68_00024754 [Brassica cretica]|uniref:BHLH domain-containing protein n=1 Tax=Brassica cretica TaxID=69181 RepID=A0A8S9IG58_BRACR|nr:hypothetical protein F2Q68_00024754 [Brassica cretica]